MEEKKYEPLRNIPFNDKLGYGAGNLGSGIIFQALNTYIVFYATAVLNIPGLLVGLAVGISIIWDGLTDPVMGYISDRTSMSFLGRRHFYLLLGAFFTALINYYLWVISPELPLNIKFLWLLAGVILVKTFLTIFSTPYVAMGAELSCDYNERTSIQAIRTVFFILGIFLASALGLYLFFGPTPEYPLGQLNPGSYRNLGLASSIIMLAFGLVTFFVTFKYIPRLYQIEKENSMSLTAGVGSTLRGVIADLIIALKNLDYRAVVLGYLFTNLTVALFAALGLHVFTFTFNMINTEIAIVVGVQFILSILSQPFWVKISAKLDKKPAALLGLSLSFLAGLLLLAAVLFRRQIIENYLLLLPYAVLAGFGTGGLFTLPASMVADIIDVAELKNGIRLEGIYYGGLTFAYKTSQSIAILLLGVFLDLIGFDAAREFQSGLTLMLMGLLLAIGGMFFIILAFIFYKNYRLDQETISRIQKRIDR